MLFFFIGKVASSAPAVGGNGGRRARLSPPRPRHPLKDYEPQPRPFPVSSPLNPEVAFALALLMSEEDYE